MLWGRLDLVAVRGGRDDTAPGPDVRTAGAGHVCADGSANDVCHLLTMASTSRAERMRYSSPLYLTSVPPYLE